MSSATASRPALKESLPLTRCMIVLSSFHVICSLGRKPRYNETSRVVCSAKESHHDDTRTAYTKAWLSLYREFEDWAHRESTFEPGPRSEGAHRHGYWWAHWTEDGTDENLRNTQKRKNTKTCFASNLLEHIHRLRRKKARESPAKDETTFSRSRRSGHRRRVPRFATSVRRSTKSNLNFACLQFTVRSPISPTFQLMQSQHFRTSDSFTSPHLSWLGRTVAQVPS